MASEYDGSVKLAATFDTKYIKKSAQEMRKEMDKAFDSTSSMKMTKEIDNLRYSIKGVAREYDDVVERMHELENTKVPTQEYNELMKEFDKLAGKLGPLTEKQLEMQEAGKVNTKEWHKLGIEIGTVNAQMDTLQQEMTELRKNNTAFTSGTQTKEYQNLIKKADDLANKMRIVKQRTDEQVNSQGRATEGYKALSTVLGTLWKDVKTLTGHLKQAAVNLAKMVKSSIINGIKKLGSYVGQLGKHASNSDFSFKRLFRTLLAYGLGTQTIFSLVNKLRNAVIAGLESFKEYEDGLNPVTVAMNEFQTSLQYLQNSVASAFAPILTTVLPILTSLIDRLAQAIQMVGAFFNALKGASTYTKALRNPYKSKEEQNAEKAEIKAQNTANKKAAKEDLAQRKQTYKQQVADFKAAQKERNKEIREAESSNKQITKNNAKIQKNTNIRNLNTKAITANTNALKKQKGELAGFDDLDVLGEATDDTDALQNLLTIPPELADTLQDFNDALDELPELLQDVDKAFEEANIPEWVTDLAQKIKDFISQNDWYGLGAFLGEKLNGLMQVVDDWINNVLRPEGVKWAGRIAELLNGLIHSIDWVLLGTTIADGLNSVFDIINTFLTTFDFLGLGQRVGQSIKTIFDKIEWDLIGQTIANKWNALILFIEGIVTTPGIWDSIGSAMGVFFKNLFATLKIDDLATIIISIFNGITQLINGFLREHPFEGLAQSLYEAINRIIHEVRWDMLGKALSDLVISLLDVFMEVAENTDWVGFGEAIGNFLGSIDWVGILGRVAKILWDVFSGIIAGLFSTDAGKVFLGIVAGMEALKLAFILGANLLLPAIKTALIEKLAQILLTEGVSGIFPAMVTAVTSAFSSVLSFIVGIGPAIVSAISGIISTVTGVIQAGIALLLSPEGLIIAAIAALLTAVFFLIYNNWDTISAQLGKIADWLKDMWSGIVTWFHDNFTMGIIDELKDMVNLGIQMLEDFVNGIIAGINMAIGGINTLAFDVPDWVPIIGGQHLGFNIPYIPYASIPKLAQGAVIPPNKQFLAMLGDQKSGTNIEAPLDTIVEAFREVVGNMQVQNTGYSEMTLDGQTFARLATPYIISELDRKGYNVNVLEA